MCFSQMLFAGCNINVMLTHFSSKYLEPGNYWHGITQYLVINIKKHVLKGMVTVTFPIT